MSIHHSLWKATSQATVLPVLDADTSTDILIIGGGITGITTAWLLHRAGKQVTLIEGETLGAGVTSCTSGHLTTAFDPHFSTLADKYSLEVARKIHQGLAKAIDFIEQTIGQESIDAQFERVNGYLYAETSRQQKQLEKEYATLSKMDVEVALTDDLPLPFAVKEGIIFPNQARFHVLNYLYTLAHKLSSQGVSMYQHTKAQQVKENETGVTVTLANGHTIEAGKVVLATHAPLGINAVQTAIAPYRSYVVAAKVKKLPANGLFWDLNDPYRYIRQAQYNDEPILIVGGFDHKTGQHDNTKDAYIALQDYVRSRFGLDKLLFSWSAQVFEPADKLPFIGKSPFQEHTYMATGYSGDGLTWGTTAAHIISDLITSGGNHLIDVVAPGRLHVLAGAKEFIKENTNVAYRFIKDRLAINKEDVKNIQAGEGKLIRYDDQQLAVYRDEQGTYHAMSPVCSHLKCIVRWNSAEKTWDCPCHGGRYNCTGEILEGPPMHNLNPVDISIT